MLTMLIEIGWFHQGAWRGEKILVGPFEAPSMRSNWLAVFWCELEKLNHQLEVNNRECLGGSVEFDAKSTDRLHLQTTTPELVVKSIEKLYTAARTC